MRIANRNFAPTLFAVAITIAAVVMFVRLAFWQLGRAAEKDALQTQYAAGQRSVVELTAANAATLTQYQRVRRAATTTARTRSCSTACRPRWASPAIAS